MGNFWYLVICWPLHWFVLAKIDPAPLGGEKINVLKNNKSIKKVNQPKLIRFQILRWLLIVSSVPHSGVYFQGTTIGMAPIMSMCTVEQSGGIVMVRQPHFLPNNLHHYSVSLFRLSARHSSHCLLKVARARGLTGSGDC